MKLEQLLLDEIQESRRWVNTAEGVYKRDLKKRIELINWVLQNMKNPDTQNDKCIPLEPTPTLRHVWVGFQ
jgi:hypothetical protein